MHHRPGGLIQKPGTWITGQRLTQNWGFPWNAADAKLGGDQPVIGIEIGGQARAYPVRVMGSHEIVNTTCGGKPIAVTW